MTRVLWAGLVWSAACFAADLFPVSGQMAGKVTNAAGLPQMGASVSLVNRYEAVVGKALTSDAGEFEFPILPAGIYSIQVSMPRLVSAVRKNISVEPGMRSFVSVNLSSLLGSIDFIYLAPSQRVWMTEDWKWALRGSGSTRPGLRFLPGTGTPQQSRVRSAVFSDTKGLIKVSAGDGASTTAYGNQTDLGTAFAVATSLFGGHRLEVSGNLGYGSNAGVPTAGFHTSFSPAGNEGAEVGLTMRQVYLAGRAGTALLTGSQAPILRTYEINIADRRRIAQDLLLEYGSTLESVVFLDRLNYFSPYARLSWGSEEEGLIKAGYSSGAPPVALMGTGAGHATDLETSNHLQDGLSALSMLPRLSLRNGSAQVQRTENFEVGYVRAAGGRKIAASVYQETMKNAAAMIAGADGLVPAGDLLPDLGSRSSVFNYGRLFRKGATVTVTQSFGEILNATAGYAYTGALVPTGSQAESADAQSMRQLLGTRAAYRKGVLARVSGKMPVSGTVYSASYLWTDYRAFQPMHYSLVQTSQFDPGLSVSVRQPVPGVSGLFPGRVEATADLRNLLAQGYVPLDLASGRRMLLIHSPRAVRGGLSFIF